MSSPVTPSPGEAIASAERTRPPAGSPHCPKYQTGSGILADGDLHDSVDPGGSYLTFNKGQRLAPDWKVTTLNINVIGTTFWSFDHLCSIDLDGESAVGGIEHHTFATQQGASYTLTFLMSGNSYCGPITKIMKVAVGNKSVLFKWNTSGGNSVQYGKVKGKRLNFNAIGSTSTLKFTSLDTAGSGCGPVIGAIAVTKV